jgi:hypothetical protein
MIWQCQPAICRQVIPSGTSRWMRMVLNRQFASNFPFRDYLSVGIMARVGYRILDLTQVLAVTKLRVSIFQVD